MILYYDIFLKKQISRQMFYQGRTISIPRRIINIYKYSRKKCGQEDK